jgi:glycosyltransferase involved in cell wall biosynthesis
VHIGLIIYGSLDTLSGGYLYDRMLVRALEASGHRVSVLSLPWRTYARHLTDNWRAEWRRRLCDAPVDLWLQDELNHPSLFWLNRWLHRVHPAPIAAVVHHLRSSEVHPRSLLPLYRCVECAYLRTLDAVLANSRTTLAAVQTLQPSTRPTHIAWPAADHLHAPAEIDAATIVTRGLLSERLRILFVGNLIPRKGLHHLLKALSAVDDSWELSVVGQVHSSDGYANDIHTMMRQLNLSHRVRFLGRIDDTELVEQYRRHHLFALPSYEGFGIAYLEAQRFGLPVIALTSGAAQEVIFDGQTGILVRPGDTMAISSAIGELASNRERLVGMGLAARLRYTLHPTWAQSMAGAVQWMEQLARRH